MLRLTTLSNQYLRRTLRVLYNQTRAYPYDVQLDPAFNRNAGALSGGTSITGAQAAILPGLVAVKEAGEVVTPAYSLSTQRAFGLFANFVGGTLSDIPSDFDRVGVWRGSGSVYEILAPCWNDTNLATYAAAEDGTAAHEVYFTTTDATARLTAAQGADAGDNTVARLISRLSANAVIVELLV